MRLSEALSKQNIRRMVEFDKLAKDKFGDDLYSSSIKKNYKQSYDGIVETKQGLKFFAKVREISDSHTSVNWRLWRGD